MSEERITTFDQLLSMVKGRERKRLAIASAEGGEIIEAVKQATEEKIVSAILIGDQAKIKELCSKRRFWTRRAGFAPGPS